MTATARTRIKARILPRFPANVVASLPVAVARSGSTYTFSFSMTGIGLEPTPPSGRYLMTWDGTAIHLTTIAQAIAVTSFTLANISDMSPEARAFNAALTDALMRAELGAAPATPSYLTLATNTELTSERVLTAGANISLTDAGAGSTLTIALSAAELNALALLASTGFVSRTTTATYAARTLTAPAAGLTITNPAGIAGDPTFALANDLAALEALGSTGFAARTTTDTWAQRTLTAPAAGIAITNPAGVAGNPTFALANDLAAYEGLAANGLVARTADGAASVRTLTAPAAGFTITNGDGVSGNPTFVLADDLAALEALAGTNTIYYRSAANTWTAVTVSTGLTFASGVLAATGSAPAFVDRAYTEYTTNADLTTAIPADDTIPQVGEGTQILSAAITPKTTTNRIRARVLLAFSSAATALAAIAALYRNGAANALSASIVVSAGADLPTLIAFEFEDVPGSTSAQTYTVRVGPPSGTIRLNGISTARRLGGAQRATLVLDEISA